MFRVNLQIEKFKKKNLNITIYTNNNRSLLYTLRYVVTYFFFQIVAIF